MARCLLIISLILFSKIACLSQVANPFSVFHGSDTVTFKAVPEVNAPVVTVSKDLNKLEVENPFTISHIPIRKNQYKKIESLKTTQKSSDKETISISYLPLWIMCLSLCLLAFMLFLKRNHINILLRSVMNDNFMRMTGYDENLGKSWPYVLGYGLFIINVALFIVLVLQRVFEINESYMLLWAIVLCTIFFLGKHLLAAFFSWVFDYKKESGYYQFMIISFRNIMSLIFLALNIVFVFGSANWSNALGLLGVGIFLIFLLSRYYKGIKIARSFINSHFFQFFIYFCAFELAPWVIIYKVVKDLL
jgi:hypothetical protein